MAGGQDRTRAPQPSVTTSETFRTRVGADSRPVQAPPLAPAGSPLRTPIPTGPKRTYSTADLVQAWKAEFPGEFDSFNNADLVDAIFAEQPELRNVIDPSSFGTESVPPPNLGGYELGPMKKAPTGPVAPPPDKLRTPTYTDMAIEAGLVAVPSVMGGSIGSSVGPGGTAIGAAAGGMAGEALREGYQNWSGTRDDGISLPNVAVQGLINAVPVAKYAGKGLAALAPGLEDAVAPAVARIAGSTLEGAVSSGASTVAESTIRDHRLPELGEVGMSTLLGAPFGAAIGAGGEAVHAVQAARALPDPALVDMHFNDLRTSPNRNGAAQAIYDLATQVGKDNPAAGAAMLQRLVTEANALAQADLQQYAGSFVKDFGTRADTLTMDGQLSEIEGFLAGLKQRGAVDATIQQVQGILTDIRTTSSPRPIDQPSEVGWYTPLDPAYGPKGPSEFSPLNRTELIPDMGPEVDPGATKSERAFGSAFERTLETPAPQRGGPPALVAPDAGAFSEGRNPPRMPEQQELGVPPSTTGMRDGRDVGTLPEFQVHGVDALPAVQTGRVSRENGLMLQWLLSDLQEFQYQAPEAPARGLRDERALDTHAAEQSEVGGPSDVLWSPHVAGTPILKMFDALGIGMTRSQIATQIDNFLQGRARRPGKAAVAAQKIATAMGEAWDPVARKFDWSLISDERLADIGFRSRRDFQSPMGNLHEQLGGQRQPNDLMEKFGVRRPQEGPPPALTHSDWAPDEMHEARKLVRGASDQELLALHENLKLGGGVENLEAPEEFNGAWYEVGPGMVGAELERRGLGKYQQQPLMTEGPGTPGSLPLKGPELEEEAPVRTPEEQPALLPEVREAARQQPLLADEADLFRLTAEIPKGTRPKGPSLFDETGAVGDVAGKRNQRNAAIRELAIDDADFQTLKEKVESAGEQEVAGLILGDSQGNIRKVIVSDNRAANPAKTFEIGADVVAAAQQMARANGWDVLSSFHSQPTGSAEPSTRDLKGTVSDLPMMILGVRGGSLRDVRVWQPSGSVHSPWLEGVVRLGTEKPKPGTAVPPAVAGWMVDRIPKFKGAPGDAPAMTDYLRTHKAEFNTEPWYVRAQQYLEDGNARMAWVEVQAATVATQKAARETVRASPLKDAHRDALVARIEQATAAGPQDPVGALFALYDGRTDWVEGVGRIVVAPEVPPALKGKGVTAGPGGILQPGAASIPLPSEQQVVGMTVAALNDVLKDVNGHGILDDPTQNSFTRLNRQIAEQLMLRSPSSWGAMKSWQTAMKQQGMSERQINQQIAAHLTKTATESGRFLAALSVWKQKNKAEIRAIEGITGASGELEDALILGAGGRQLGRLGDLAPIDTFKDIVAPTRAWDRVMLLNDLTKSERGSFDTFEASSRSFMLSQWATAARNFWTVNARWGVEMFDELGSAVASTTLARPGRALKHLQKAGDLLRYTPILRPDGWVMPWHARQAQWEQIFDSTTYLANLPMGAERRAALKLLEGIPEEAAHFLGATNYGEPTPHQVSKYRILNAISNPKVQNTLTMFNRAQEFTARSGMYVANLRDELRNRGLDPDLLYHLPPADLAAKLGGADEMRRVLHHAVSGALDFTFSGALIKKGFGKDEFNRPKGAMNASFIDLVNKFPAVRAGYPWPKFNLSAAPRFIWDHSGVNGVVETLNQVLLEHTGGTVGVQRGRFYLGKKGAYYADTGIPELQSKYRDAQADLGGSLQKVQALSREFNIRKRMMGRLERKGLLEAANAERPNLALLEQGLQREMESFERTDDRMKGLNAQINGAQAIVDQAKDVRAPQTYAELWGRAGAGIATLLTPALLLRADQQEKGTRWYELRYNIPGMGDTVIDTRPFAPFTQYLFLADVMNDLSHNTDWAGVSEDLDNQVPMSEAIYGRYEGKYTNKTLGTQAMNAFISMSQAAGTTLAILQQFTSIGDKGFPSPGELADTTVAALGSLLARFTIPFAQLKGATDSMFETESNARITSTDQGWAAPLAQPVGNLPFLGAAAIPETYNQLTGQPLDAFRPDLRAGLGITLRQFDRVSGEINATGVPGSAVYIRSTHDVFLDRLIGYNYSSAVSQYADSLIFANEYYLGLDSPAARRDYLQSVAFPTLKKIALGNTMLDVGWARMQEAREGPEQRRRRLRVERLQGLAKQEGVDFSDEPEPAAEPDPGSEPDGNEPSESTPPAPAGPPPSGQARYQAPAFEDGDDREVRPPGALDRVLGPAFGD